MSTDAPPPPSPPPPLPPPPQPPAPPPSWTAKLATATSALIAVNVLIFVAEVVWGGSENLETLFRMGANVGLALALAEPWRLLASAFLHIGPAHLLMNMWVLYVLGHSIETLLRPARFLVLYTLCAFAGSLASVALHPAAGRLAAGASGAIWGLLGAQIAIVFRPPPAVVVREGATRSVMRMLIVNVGISLLPQIDMAAHFGGGAVGAALVLLRAVTGRLQGRPDDPGARAWTVAAAVAATAIVASLALALLHGRPWEVSR